jgi:hypothetical protein
VNKRKYLIYFLFILVFRCSSTKIKGDEFREVWLKENLYNEEVDQKPIRPDETKIYNLTVAVLISEKNLIGEEWNQKRRRQKPNLKLYLLKGDYEQNLICEKMQSVTLHCEYPLKLQGQDILNFRVVDRQNTYYREEYGEIDERDSEYSRIKEEPLAQLDFLFTGQGKYMKNSGAATFVFTFKELKIK